MTVSLNGEEVQARVGGAIQDSIESWNVSDVWVPSGLLHEVCKFAKEDPELGMDFRVAIDRKSVV